MREKNVSEFRREEEKILQLEFNDTHFCSFIQVLAQIIENEENVARLRKAIADKQPPLMLAETRLDTRKNRPNVELCRDPVQYRLIEEVSSQSAETAPKLVGCLAEWVEEEG